MKMNKVRVTIVMLVIITICSVLFLVFRSKDHEIRAGLTIEFKGTNKIIEYGSEFDTSSLVDSTTGEIKEYPNVDTMTLGDQELTFVVERENVKKEFSYVVTVKDTQGPLISLTNDVITLKQGTEFTPSSYITFIKDPVDGDIPYSKEVKGENYYTFEHDVDVYKTGTYVLLIIAVDKHGNKKEQKVEVVVKSPESESIEGNENTANNVTYINGILLVNKKYSLPESFGSLDDTAYGALLNLQAGAAMEGHQMPLISGYRSYSYQAQLYNAYVAKDGQAEADRYSAKPGTSEHQTGLAFDVGELDFSYGETAAGKWLAEHAHEYGFILRYPQGKESITGYLYEPWHIRYLGVEVASDIYKKNITLEEYLNVE